MERDKTWEQRLQNEEGSEKNSGGETGWPHPLNVPEKAN
jgi:hypothetical protein